MDSEKSEVIILRTRLTQTVVQKAEPQNKRYTLHDDILQGLMLRVEPSGSKLYYIDYRKKDGRRMAYKLGRAELFTVAEAREKAKEFLARVALGEDTGKKKNAPTLGEYLEETYFPWVRANHKSGEGTISRIRCHFGFLWDSPVKDIDVVKIERWRIGQLQKNKAASINRTFNALKAAVNWGYKHKTFDVNPLARLEPLQERDSQPRVRYLSPDERERLMTALDERERKSADHLKPMVIISLNTGARRGALFALRWSDVDMEKKMLALRGEEGKSGRTYYVPLNSAAYNAFGEWRQCSTGELVFPSQNGERMHNCKSSFKNLLKKAKIENFRWHDMRHDFASQLVMKGIDLNTVRELMGHADLKMTLRYAHLAPEMKARAVEALD
jgi:integrase